MGHSPLPKPSKEMMSNAVVGTMRFPDAVAAIVEGQRVTKLEWDDLKLYGQLRDGILMIHLEDGWHQWILNDGDLLGDDWVIL